VEATICRGIFPYIVLSIRAIIVFVVNIKLELNYHSFTFGATFVVISIAIFSANWREIFVANTKSLS